VDRLHVTSEICLGLEADRGRRRRGGGGSADVARERDVAGVLATVSDEVRRLTERTIAQTTHVRLFACACTERRDVFEHTVNPQAETISDGHSTRKHEM